MHKGHSQILEKGCKRKLNSGDIFCLLLHNFQFRVRVDAPKPEPKLNPEPKSEPVNPLKRKAETEDPRPVCEYDGRCYRLPHTLATCSSFRKNPQHFKEYAHPSMENPKKQKVDASQHTIPDEGIKKSEKQQVPSGDHSDADDIIPVKQSTKQPIKEPAKPSVKQPTKQSLREITSIRKDEESKPEEKKNKPNQIDDRITSSQRTKREVKPALTKNTSDLTPAPINRISLPQDNTRYSLIFPPLSRVCTTHGIL